MLRLIAQRAISQFLAPKTAFNALASKISLLAPFLPQVVPVSRPTPVIASKSRPLTSVKRYYCTAGKGDPKDAFKNATEQASFKVKSSSQASSKKTSNTAVAMYAVATLVAVGGLSYAAVPLYKMFCAATGYGGTTKVADSKTKAKIIYDHPITIRFTSQVSDTLPWSFTPVQREMTVLPGEKALAFYVATNHHTEALVGVATYNVVPDLSGAYFNKIQCFCFDEQRLNPGETVNMPIHFFVDPAIEEDKYLRGINEITLSYTFFLADDQSAEWWEEEREKHARPTSS